MKPSVVFCQKDWIWDSEHRWFWVSLSSHARVKFCGVACPSSLPFDLLVCANLAASIDWSRDSCQMGQLTLEVGDCAVALPNWILAHQYSSSKTASMLNSHRHLIVPWSYRSRYRHYPPHHHRGLSSPVLQNLTVQVLYFSWKYQWFEVLAAVRSYFIRYSSAIWKTFQKG